jgi:putative nucleotidyltransferase with HDIG domain
LDLRDKETKGHTQRVTDLTRLLAKALGFGGVELEHITRGALLHDIGKMGIPDSILLKPGELTDDEREHMKQHPLLAYEMLRPIDFLNPALDIPYCHHEKWDGTGYPRGLQGEEIPVKARVFSIVDVWDALTSDRPYRKAMAPGEVRDYIRQQSATAFDGRIVDVFLGLGDSIHRPAESG